MYCLGNSRDLGKEMTGSLGELDSCRGPAHWDTKDNMLLPGVEITGYLSSPFKPLSYSFHLINQEPSYFVLPGYLALWLAFCSRALLLVIPGIQLRNASGVQGRGRLGRVTLAVTKTLK